MNLLMQAEIFSVTGLGKLRVTYNWMYSALNCALQDNSPFIWNVYQTSGHTIVLSPHVGYAGKTLYASVRDDGDWYLQVQAPHSADWITAAQRDEFIGLQMFDLGLARLTGFNNQLIGVVNQPDWATHTQGSVTAGIASYRLRSAYTTPAKETTWFLKIVGNGAAVGASVSGTITRSAAFSMSLDIGLQAALERQGIHLSAQELSTLTQQINA
jgi:hypothetical protein